MKKYRFLLFVNLLFMLSCGPGGAVKSAFEQIVNRTDVHNVEPYLNEESIDYLQQLNAIVKDQTINEAKSLGKKYGVPLMTMKLFAEAKFLTTQDDSSTFTVFEAHPDEMLFLILYLSEGGILSMNAKEKLNFMGISHSGSQQTSLANIEASIGNNTYIATKYLFTLESDEWKLDLPSTFEYLEKIYKQNLRRSGQSDVNYISGLVENSVSSFEFKYRTQ